MTVQAQLMHNNHHNNNTDGGEKTATNEHPTAGTTGGTNQQERPETSSAERPDPPVKPSPSQRSKHRFRDTQEGKVHESNSLNENHEGDSSSGPNRNREQQRRTQEITGTISKPEV